MNEDQPCRLRITFRKETPLRYISHLDLLRAWERALRRARLPLAYSRGFNPHPQITIAMPLAVGHTGEREVVDIVLNTPLSTDQIAASLEPALPQGLEVVDIEQVPLRSPAMPSLIRQATYQVTLCGVPARQVEERIEDLLQRAHVEVQFRRKTFDLRPLIASLELVRAASTEEARSGTAARSTPHSSGLETEPRTEDTGENAETEQGVIVLETALTCDNKGRIGRPDVLLQALGLSEYAQRIHRTHIAFASPGH
jgi:radical SAM-linked protein